MRILSTKKISEKELSVLCRQMKIMYNSGCDIINILEIIARSSSENLGRALIRTKKGIESGKNITDSFKYSNSFSKFFIYMINAGEVSGRIDYVLEQLSNYYDKENKLKRKLMGAMVYPIVLLIVMLFTFLFMLLFVIPNFEMAFDFDGMSLPIVTRFIFWLSKFLRGNLMFIFVSTIAAVFMLYRFVSDSDYFKVVFDRKKFEIPKMGELFKLIISDKLSRVLFILMSSGVYIGESLDLAVQILNDSYVEKRLISAKIRIEQGNGISESLRFTGLFPDMFISMILSGEESGNFEESLRLVSEYYSNELDLRLEYYVKMIEPLMIVIVGIMVGTMVIAILSPMFELISTIR